MTSTGSISKGVLQYSENMVTMVFRTMPALVRSVPVHSMNTSLVCRVICRQQGRFFIFAQSLVAQESVKPYMLVMSTAEDWHMPNMTRQAYGAMLQGARHFTAAPQQAQ